MLSNAHFLANFRFDTAENEPAKNLQNFRKVHFSKMHFSKVHFSKMHLGCASGRRRPGGRAGGARAAPRRDDGRRRPAEPGCRDGAIPRVAGCRREGLRASSSFSRMSKFNFECRVWSVLSNL